MDGLFVPNITFRLR
ncbi:MAG: hypothetical protein ACLR13_07030 [Acutalibacteraceae bacterium]